MPTSLGFANSAGFRGRKFEPMTSSNANRRAMVTPRGILRGFRPVPDAAVQTLKLEVDPLLGDSLMNVTPVDLADTSDGFALTYRETTSITLDLSDEAGTTIFVGLTSKYNILSFGSAIPPNWYAYTQAEIDDGTANEAVIICSVDVPASAIPLVAVDIDESERDESWMWVSARGGKDIPLVTPSYDDLFLYWSFQNLAASSTLATTTAEKKRGNSSILLDVDDVGAVTNEFGPGEVVSVVPGELLFVKFWYRTSASVNFSTNPLFKVEFLTSDGSPLGTTDISIPTAPQTNFTLIQDQILVPATGHRAIFSFDVQTNGVTDFYVDCLQVYARRLDSDASGWLDDNDKFLARNMGVHTLYFRNEHTHATQGPWTFGVGSGSGGLQFRRKIGVNSAIWLGDEEDSSVQMGINTTSPDTMLHLRGDPEDTTVIRMELDKTAIVANDVYGRIEWEGQDSDTDASGVRGSIAGIAEDTSGKMAIVFHTAASAESPPVAEVGRFSSTGLGLGDFSDSTDVVDTLLHLRDTVSGGSVIRLELDSTTITDAEVYGRIEFEGQDAGTAASGVRGYVEGVAEGVEGALALSFAAAAANVGSPVEVMRVNRTGVGLGITFSAANPVSTLLHLQSSTDGSVIRLERNDISIDNGDIYGRLEWEGQDSGGAGVRSSIQTQAEAGSGGTAIAFATAKHGAGTGVTVTHAKINNLGTLIIADDFTAFDTTDTTNYGFDYGNNRVQMILEAGGTSSEYPTVLAIWNSDSNAKAGITEIIGYRQGISLTKAGKIRFNHQGVGSEHWGEVAFFVNDGTATLTTSEVMRLSSDLGTNLHIQTRPLVMSNTLGTAPTNISVGIEINSTTHALLLPRMNTTQRDALTEVTGMLIFNTQTNTVQFTNNTPLWVNL